MPQRPQSSEPLCYEARLAIVLILTLPVLCCCSNERPSPEYLYYRLNADAATLDPAFITDVNNATIAAKLYRGLLMLDESLQVVPDLAERWELLEQGRLYRFYLREGATFCNGRTLTAYDVEYSYNRVLAKSSPNRWVFDRVESFRAINNNVFEIRLKGPFSPFLAMLTMPAGYVVPKEEVERWGRGFAFHPCGAGGYSLESWLPGREIRLKARGAMNNQSAALKGIVYRIIPEDLTAISEFELGNIDVLGIPGSAYLRFKRDPKWSDNIMASHSLNTYYLGFNLERPPFRDNRLRRAVALAIDRAKILDAFMDKRGQLSRGIVPDLLRQWEIRDTIRFDPAMSKRLLDETGLKGVKPLMLITAEQEVLDLAEIIQGYLKQVGIEVVIRQMEWSAFKEAVNKGEADMFWLSWWADYPEAENFLFPLFHSSNKGYGGNRTRYSNPKVDALLEQARGSRDKRRADALYKKVEDIILEELPLIPFWHRIDYIARQDWVDGFKPYPIYTMDKGLTAKKMQR